MDSVNLLQLLCDLTADKAVVGVGTGDDEGENARFAVPVGEFLADAFGKLETLDVTFVVVKHLDNGGTVLGIQPFQDIFRYHLFQGFDLVLLFDAGLG